MALPATGLQKEAVENLPLKDYLLILDAVTSQRGYSALLTKGRVRFLAVVGFSKNLFCAAEQNFLGHPPPAAVDSLSLQPL